VIPQGMRKTIRMLEKCYVIVRPAMGENKIEIIRPAISEDTEVFRLRISFPDKIRLIAQISGIFAWYNSSMIFNHTMVLNHGIEAEWTALAILPNLSLDQFLQFLIKEEKATCLIFEDTIEDGESR